MSFNNKIPRDEDGGAMKSDFDESEVSMMEYLMTEHEDDTDFGKKMSRLTCFIVNIGLCLQAIIILILSILNFVSRHIFAISLAVCAFVILIAYVM